MADARAQEQRGRANMSGRAKKYYGLALFAALSALGLWASSLYSYLLFHGIAELFSIVVACCIFVLAWNSRRVAENSYLLFLGIAYLFVATLDLLHTLAYEGMGVFQRYETGLATQLWVSARYVEAGSLFLAPFLIRRRLKAPFVLAGYALITALLLASIFKWHVFPECYVEGVGLTLFKKVSEYVIMLLLVASIVVLFRRRRQFEPGLLRLLIASIVVTIASEFAFTLYVDVTGYFNLIGHYLKIASFYLIYRAVVETGLAKPLALLFRDLKQREKALQAAKDNLEVQVDERTAELRESMGKLREAELRYRTIANFTYDWEWWTDPQGRFIYVSPSCERVTGYKAQEFMRNPSLIEDIVVDEDKSRVTSHIHRSTKQEPEEILFRIRRRDGHVRWIEHRCQSVLDEAGTCLGIRGSNRDITDRKLAEEQVAQSREHLRMLAGKLLSAQEEERSRLARELHDDLTQRLAILAIDIGKLQGKLTSVPDSPALELNEIRERIVELSADVHDISRQLHPAILDDLGLRQAIQSECANFTKREGIAIKYEPKDVPSLIPRDVSVCLFRIVQESLRNIAKHAKVKEARVSLLGGDGDITLVVEDSGAGFDVAQTTRKRGLGLASMHERVRLIRGDFSVESEPGKGTIIKVVAPLSGQ